MEPSTQCEGVGHSGSFRVTVTQLAEVVPGQSGESLSLESRSLSRIHWQWRIAASDVEARTGL